MIGKFVIGLFLLTPNVPGHTSFAQTQLRDRPRAISLARGNVDAKRIFIFTCEVRPTIDPEKPALVMKPNDTTENDKLTYSPNPTSEPCSEIPRVGQGGSLL